MSNIYKNKPFSKWQKKEMVTDRVLKWAVSEIEAGLFEAKFSGVLYKKRVPVLGRGKRAGARTLVAYKEGNHTFFLHGFLKNEKENISTEEQEALVRLAKFYMTLAEKDLDKMIKDGVLQEISDEA
jgi:hypothetical protein